MGDIWFCVVIIIFAYFAPLVARTTPVLLSGNAFYDNCSVEELKIEQAQSGCREFGLTESKMMVYCNMTNERASSSLETAYLIWSNIKFITWLFLYCYILKYAVDILRDCRSINTNIGDEENLLVKLKRSLSNLKNVLTKEDYSLGPRNPYSCETTNISDTSPDWSESSIEISESEESLASGSAHTVPHLSNDQTTSSSLASTASFVRKSGLLASTASFVRRSGGCFGLIYNFNYFPLYIYSSPNLNQNSSGSGELFLQRPSMRNSWLKTQSRPSVFYVNKKKRWYVKGTINYVSSASSKDYYCKRWKLAESSVGGQEAEQCHSASLSSLQSTEDDYVRSLSIRSVADHFTVKLNGETGKKHQVVNHTRCWSSVADFSMRGNGLLADGRRGLSLAMVYPSLEKSLSQDDDANVIDDVRDEGGVWQLSDSCENQQQLDATENQNSFHDMLKDIWTNIKIESHHQIIVPLLLHTAKTCFLEFGVNYS